MNSGPLEIKNYLGLFLRWWWLLALAIICMTTVTYYITIRQPPSYRSTVRIILENQGNPGLVQASEIRNSSTLARNYIDLIKTRPFLTSISDNLPVRYNLAQLSKKFSARVQRNSIYITVSDPNPVLAAAVANSTAETFIEVVLDRQISQLRNFNNVLAQYGLEQSEDAIALQAARFDILSIIDPAVPSSAPIQDPMARNLLLAVAVGMALAGIAIIAIEYFDDRVKTSDRFSDISSMPTWGSVPRYRDNGGLGVVSVRNEKQKSTLEESYNFVRTNIDYDAADDLQTKTILVTSSVSGEGKSTSAINLAISVAQSGRSVILVDSDFRDPIIHEKFDIQNEKGLSQIIDGTATIEESLVTTAVEGLKVVTNGPIVVDPINRIRSKEMETVIGKFQKMSDVLILDSPPILAVADAMSLASHVGTVLFVVDASKTGRKSVKLALEYLSQVNPAPALIGALLNRVRIGSEIQKYMGSYYYVREHNRRGFRVRLVSLRLVFGLTIAAVAIIGLIVSVLLGYLDLGQLV